METPIIDLESAKTIMASRILISRPGKYQVRVTNDVLALANSGKVHKELSGNKFQISIANFAACTPYHLNKFCSDIKEGNFEESLKKTNLTASIRDGDYIPQKNEIVEIVVGLIENKDKEDILAVIGYNALPLSQGIKLQKETLLQPAVAEKRVSLEFLNQD